MMISRAILFASALVAMALPAAATENQLLTHRGFAELDRRLSLEFLGQGQPPNQELVVYSYREHPKAAPAGDKDRCSTLGITWGGDVAHDSIYVTSMLDAPADLEVKIGSVDTTVSLPARQAADGGQIEIPIGDAVGLPSFTLVRDGEPVDEWFGRLKIVAAPRARNVSTYSDYRVIETSSGQTGSAWFEPVAMDKPEGNSGTTPFTFRFRRDQSDGSVTATCEVVAGTATASDFDSGQLPAFSPRLDAGETQADYSALVRGDTDQESDESFKVRCHDVLPTTVSSNVETFINGLIRNDDAPAGAPTFTISALDPQITEGTGGTPKTQRFLITRTGNIASAQSDIDFCPGPSGIGHSAEASDFVGGWATEIIHFDPAVATQIASTTINPDAIPEPAEQYVATLRNPSSGSIVAVGEATASIVDDDAGASGGTHINAGSVSEYVDGSGVTWYPDNGVGGAIDSTPATISGTTDQSIYQTYRYGASAYTFAMTPGKSSRVYGLFSEPDAGAAGATCPGSGRRRIAATVTAENGVRRDITVDPYCDVGVAAADRVELADVPTPTGKLTVEFRAATGSQFVPLVNGIAVEEYEPSIQPREFDWLNLGAPASSVYTDGGGNTWRGMPPSFASGCAEYTDTAHPNIDGTQSDELFWTACRGSDMLFTIPVEGDPGDTRSVSLYFSEPTAPVGARVSDIYVNGALQISGLDVRAVAGATNTAVVRVVHPVEIRDNNTVTIRVVRRTTSDVLINAIAVTGYMATSQFDTTLGWNGRRKIDKRQIIRSVSPTGLSAAGNRLEIRGINTSSTSVYACHGACDETSTRGIQPDNAATAMQPQIEISAVDPDTGDTLFPSMTRRQTIDETFPVDVVEVLPDGSLGAATVVTVHVAVTRAF